MLSNMLRWKLSALLVCGLFISQVASAHNISETLAPIFDANVQAKYDVIPSPNSPFPYTSYLQGFTDTMPTGQITATLEINEDLKSLGLAVPVREIYRGQLGMYTVTHEGVELGAQAIISGTQNVGSDGSQLSIEAVKFVPLGGGKKVATEYTFNSFLREPAYSAAMVNYMYIPSDPHVTGTILYTDTMPLSVNITDTTQNTTMHKFGYYTDTTLMGLPIIVFDKWSVNGAPWVSLKRATYTPTFEPDMRNPPIGATFPQVSDETQVFTSTSKLSPQMQHFLYESIGTFTSEGNAITYTFAYSSDVEGLMVGVQASAITDTLTYSFVYSDTEFTPLLKSWSLFRMSTPNDIVTRSVDYLKSPYAGFFPMSLFESSSQMGSAPVTVTHNNYLTRTMGPFDTGVGFGAQTSWCFGDKNGIPDVTIGSQGMHTVALSDRAGYLRFDGFESNLGLHLYGPDRNFYGTLELKMIMSPYSPTSQFGKLFLYHRDFDANRYTSLFRENPSHRNFYLLFNDPNSFPDISLQLSSGGIVHTIPAPSPSDPNRLIPAIQRGFGHLFVPIPVITHTINITTTASPAGILLR